MDDAGLLAAARDPHVRARFDAKVRRVDELDCWLWTGAISGQGHGRFWVRDGVVVIAHRYAYAAALEMSCTTLPAVLAHRCDNPLCQNPGHLWASSAGENRREWIARRDTVAGPLRDRRGARGRARAVRDAAKAGADITEVMSAGLRPVDRDQGSLW
ncbi:hypothetical protein [Luteimicrobium sp. DT211]|uniref:hypothetical protein n=1 Tax=Luteimicrobium sp. DT211 TaxID=3393412 RepID=UPI003CF52985